MRRILVAVLAAVLLVGGCATAESPVVAAATPVEVTPSPRPVEVATSPAVEAVTVAYGQLPDQFGRLTVPSSTSDIPVVVLVHGGFWRQQFDLSLMDPLAVDLAERGYAAWNIEYRRVGADGAGGWPETGDDVAAAIDHLATLAAIYPIDLEQVVLVGHSAGGHLALWSLQRSNGAVRPAGAVGLAAVVDPSDFGQARELLGGSPADVPDAYCDAMPQLDSERMRLIHGQVDRLVPLATLQSARHVGIETTIVPNENHFEVIDPASQSWVATLDAIEGFLR